MDNDILQRLKLRPDGHSHLLFSSRVKRCVVSTILELRFSFSFLSSFSRLKALLISGLRSSFFLPFSHEWNTTIIICFKFDLLSLLFLLLKQQWVCYGLQNLPGGSTAGEALSTLTTHLTERIPVTGKCHQRLQSSLLLAAALCQMCRPQVSDCVLLVVALTRTDEEWHNGWLHETSRLWNKSHWVREFNTTYHLLTCFSSQSLKKHPPTLV